MSLRYTTKQRVRRYTPHLSPSHVLLYPNLLLLHLTHAFILETALKTEFFLAGSSLNNSWNSFEQIV